MNSASVESIQPDNSLKVKSAEGSTTAQKVLDLVPWSLPSGVRPDAQRPLKVTFVNRLDEAKDRTLVHPCRTSKGTWCVHMSAPTGFSAETLKDERAKKLEKTFQVPSPRSGSSQTSEDELISIQTGFSLRHVFIVRR